MRAAPEQMTLPLNKLPYFKAMFCGNFSEQHSKSDGKISIGGVTGSALKSIMDYIYSGILKVTIENAPELLQIADLLLLEQVSTVRALL